MQLVLPPLCTPLPLPDPQLMCTNLKYSDNEIDLMVEPGVSCLPEEGTTLNSNIAESAACRLLHQML